MSILGVYIKQKFIINDISIFFTVPLVYSILAHAYFTKEPWTLTKKGRKGLIVFFISTVGLEIFDVFNGNKNQ